MTLCMRVFLRILCISEHFVCIIPVDCFYSPISTVLILDQDSAYIEIYAAHCRDLDTQNKNGEHLG